MITRGYRISQYVLAVCFTLLLAACAQVDNPSLEPLATSPSRVRLYLASGTSNNYAVTSTGQKDLLTQSCPLGFKSDSAPGSLLTITATGKNAKVCHTSTIQNLGVFSTGEGTDKKSAVNPGETLSIGLGSDTTLRGVRVTSTSLRVRQTKVDTLFEVQFYNGVTLLGKKQFSPTGSGTTPRVFTLSVGGKPFTRVLLKPIRGSFSLQGGGNMFNSSLTAPNSSDTPDTYVGVFTRIYRHSYNLPESWSGSDCQGNYITGTRERYGHTSITAITTFVFDGYNWGGGIYLRPRSIQRGGYGYEDSAIDITPATTSKAYSTRTAGKPDLAYNGEIQLSNDGSANGAVYAQYPASMLYTNGVYDDCKQHKIINDGYLRQDSPQYHPTGGGKYNQNGAFTGELVSGSGDSVGRDAWKITRQ